MAKTKTRKEFLKGPDEFLTLSNKAFNFLSAHVRELQYIGVAIGVIAIGYLAINMYMRSVNKKGQDEYNKGYTVLVGNIKPDADAQELQKSEEQFLKVIDEYGLSKAARLALPQVAYVKFVEKKYDEAIAHYEQFLNKVSGDAEYESLVNLALATCYEAKGDIETAINILKPLVEAPDNSFKEAAMLSLARLYRLDHKQEKSDKILKEFVEQYQFSPFRPMAKAHLL
ncbi:MAG: tetratricopeptide repeat protein [Desulfobacterales bacterium]|nr:tetratricopeptide repeat protein [Desulfobacterales bacterium]